MTKLTNSWALIFGLGVGATLLMDLWSAVLRRMGIATLNYAMLGRWSLHWRNGFWFHKSIKEAQPVGGENVVGWTLHYLTGIAFAQMFVLVTGRQWLEVPALAPALIFGAATVLFPWTVLQPALGAGFASAKTARPWLSRVVSLATHLFFGASLYLCARAFTAL